MSDHLGSDPLAGLRRLQPRTRRRSTRRRILMAVTLVLVAFLVWLSISLGGALTNQALGSSVGARFAEWARGHGAAGVVNWAENEWYTHHPPRVGGKPPTGEGQWSPSGRLVGGIPAVYTTTLRPDPVHTSYVVGVAWMDTKLLKATLYSGSQIPGGGPFTHSAPVQAPATSSLVAAFNAGFLMSDAQGGYYTDGRTIVPLRAGAASFVIHADGTATVGAWGTDVAMAPDVVSVRQNLDLLVNNGQPVPGLNANDTSRWGFTLGNAVYVWRSGLGVTADGALVYVGGPGLDITDLANLLVRAGAVRAMELDINTDWVDYASYAPSTAGGVAAPANGTDLLPNMEGTPARYFETWWARDFITMSAAVTPKS